MKKILGFLCILPAVFFALTSCKSQDDEEIQKPYITIDNANSSIDVSLYLKSDISYLNLFRIKLNNTTGDFQKDAKAENIAEFFPLGSSLPSIQFKDKLIVDKQMYAYCVRYFENGKYEYSGWSDWPRVDSTENAAFIPAPATGYSDADFKYIIPDGCYLEFDKTNSRLTVKGGTIEPPASASVLFDGYTPCLVVSAGSKTRPFCINYSLKIDENLTEGFIIDLRNILLKDFFDVDIKIEGLVFEKTEKKPSGAQFNQIMWSQIAPVTVKNSEGTVLNTIKVSLGATSDENHDLSGYSRFAASTADDTDNAETVPDLSAYSR